MGEGAQTRPVRPVAFSSAGLFGVSQRTPPANLEAEQALLGAILANKRAYESVAEFLKPEHFADHVHARIYEVASRRIEAGEAADAVALRSAFDNTGQLDDVGGPAYLGQLITAMVGLQTAEPYGRIIVDCWRRRQIIEACEVTMNQAFADTETDPGEHMEALRANLDLIENEGGDRTRMMGVAAAAQEAIYAAEQAYVRKGALSGISSGFRAIDRRLGGMEGGQLIILGARPGMGKTALATQIALRAASGLVPKGEGEAGFDRVEPVKTVYISLEMSAAQLGRRALALYTGTSLRDLKRGSFMSDHRQVQRHMDALKELPEHLLIEDEPALRAQAIAMRCRAARRKMKGLGLIVIDHAHIAGRGETNNRFGDTQAMTEFSNGMKHLAKALDVPVLMLCQLSRGVESRDDKRPTMSDLRQSGALEQDADAAMFLYRDEYYAQQAKPQEKQGENPDKFYTRMQEWETHMARVRGKAELIFGKVRDGETGTEMLGFDGPKVRFYDMEGEAA